MYTPTQTDTAAVMRDTVAHLARSLSDPRDFDLQMEFMADLIVDCIAEGDAPALRAAYEGVERLYSLIRPAAGEGDARCGQLRMLTTLLSEAASRPGRAELAALAAQHRDVMIELLAAETGIGADALATRMGQREAVISRALRELQAVGWVRVRREWQAQLHKLTPKGYKIAAALRPSHST